VFGRTVLRNALTRSERRPEIERENIEFEKHVSLPLLREGVKKRITDYVSYRVISSAHDVWVSLLEKGILLLNEQSR
jgi:hypothetical protein